MRIRSNSLVPPGDELPWEAIRLPDNRRPSLIGADQVAVWYRIEFAAAPADRAGSSWAVYVPHLRDGGRFFLNGQAIESIAESNDAIRVKWERPQLVVLPDRLLHASGNVLMVRTQPRLGIGFPRLSFGRKVDLQPLEERRSFWVLTMPQITIVFCAMVSLFTLLIWAARREERLYGLFGLAVLFWGLRTLTFVIEILPTEQWWIWRMIYHASTGGFVAVMALFCAGFARITPHRRVWIALFVYWLVCPVAMVMFGDAADPWLNKVWVAGFIPIGAATSGMIVLAAWRQRSGTAHALLVGLTLTLLAGVHDYLLLVGWLGTVLPDWDGHRVFLLHFGANVMLLVMGGILAQRFIQVLFDLEFLNRSLEQRVADREAQLEAQFARAHALERERATVEERRRIMEDMHDGLGSQLFQSLSRAQRGNLSQPEMADSLRACIDEMRLALEALGSDDDSFLDAIADFRFRWERQLAAAGIHSAWEIEASEGLPKFPPRTTLQYLRILQEALTNVQKHAHAREVRVSIAGRGEQLVVRIEDDGVGMPDGAVGPGHGLRNMRRRAELLGATLSVSSTSGRTLIELCAGTATRAG